MTIEFGLEVKEETLENGITRKYLLEDDNRKYYYGDAELLFDRISQELYDLRIIMTAENPLYWLSKSHDFDDYDENLSRLLEKQRNLRKAQVQVLNFLLSFNF